MDKEKLTQAGIDMDALSAGLDAMLEAYRPIVEAQRRDGVADAFPFVAAVGAVRRQADPRICDFAAELKFFSGPVLRQEGEIRATAMGDGGGFLGGGSFGRDPEGVRGQVVPVHIGFAQLVPPPFYVGQAVVHWNDVGTFTGTGFAFVGGFAAGPLGFS